MKLTVCVCPSGGKDCPPRHSSKLGSTAQDEVKRVESGDVIALASLARTVIDLPSRGVTRCEGMYSPGTVQLVEHGAGGSMWMEHGSGNG
jgi:hypothetical protein